MTGLLALSDDDLLALSPAEVERLERAALVRYQTTRRFTPAMWDVLVTTWNEAMPQERRKRHAYCVRHRHDWVELPMDAAFVCRRCCVYKVGYTGG